MIFHLTSDLHLDTYEGDTFAYDLIPGNAEALIIAGDMCGSFYLHEQGYETLQVLCDKYGLVIYVLGNHEYYGSDYEKTQDRFRYLGQKIANLSCLENEVLDCGVVVAGTTLWFPDSPMNRIYEKFMNDFSVIEGFRGWVYEKNREAVEFLRGAKEADLIVTHHLPCPKSIHPQYTNSITNRYFLCDISEILLDLGPQVLVHGHTHTPCDYRLGKTRVICNPRGYPRENKGEYSPKIIEL